jgi:hypothetical protein
MTTQSPGFLERNERRIELVFLMFAGGLFVYAVADWLHLSGSTQSFQPLRMVLLTSAMVLQPLAALLRQRSRLVFYVLIGVSAVPLVASFYVTS